MDKDSKTRKGQVPLICGYCGSRNVKVFRNAERVLVRCEDCHERLLSYYADPDRWDVDGAPTRDGDPFLVQQVEQHLLSQVDEPARALYAFLRRYLKRYGYAPTLREMQAGVGWASPNTVTYRLHQLEEVKLIERDYGAARGIRLLCVA